MAERQALVRRADGTVEELTEISAAELRRHADDAGEILWLDLTAPGAAELELLRDGVSLHPLAAEDMQKRRQRPKLDAYPSQYVIVAYEILEGTSEEHYRPGEIHLVVSRGVLVSAHWEPSPVLAGVARRFASRTRGTGENSGALLYSILDAITDGYFPLLDRISDTIEGVEESIMAGRPEPEMLQSVLRLKRELLELRRIVAPLRDVANALLRRELEVVQDHEIPYYQDLYDHLVRVLDAIDLYRDMLAAALDANLAIASNSLNLIVKRLTALTVILMLPTLIAGIYGMNFDVMPELRWVLGYPYALVLMLAAVGGAVLFFRWRDWI